jgi:hypothetical protein
VTAKPNPATPAELRIRRGNGGVMMAVGGLLALLSGSCTGWVGGWTWNFGAYWAVPAVVGGVPFVAGLGLFVSGWLMRRRAVQALRRHGRATDEV